MRKWTLECEKWENVLGGNSMKVPTERLLKKNFWIKLLRRHSHSTQLNLIHSPTVCTAGVCCGRIQWDNTHAPAINFCFFAIFTYKKYVYMCQGHAAFCSIYCSHSCLLSNIISLRSYIANITCVCESDVVMWCQICGLSVIWWSIYLQIASAHTRTSVGILYIICMR